MDLVGVAPLDPGHIVAVAGEEGGHPGPVEAAQHRRIRNLVLIEVQDRQHRTVTGRVEEPDAFPASLQRPGLGFTITDHCRDQQVRVVERGAEGVHQSVAEFAALVDRPWRRDGDVARYPPGGGELPDQPGQARQVPRHLWVDLRIGAFQIGVGDQRRAAVPRPGHVQHILPSHPYQPVQLGIHQVQRRGRTPVTQQPRLDLPWLQCLAQQWIGTQIDLRHRQIICGLPVPYQPAEGHLVQIRNTSIRGCANSHPPSFLQHGTLRPAGGSSGCRCPA